MGEAADASHLDTLTDELCALDPTEAARVIGRWLETQRLDKVISAFNETILNDPRFTGVVPDDKVAQAATVQPKLTKPLVRQCHVLRRRRSPTSSLRKITMQSLPRSAFCHPRLKFPAMPLP